MRSKWEHIFTESAADEDVRHWLASLGRIMQEVFTCFTEPFPERYLLRESDPVDFLAHILSSINLHPPGNQQNRPCFNYYHGLRVAVRNMYLYAAGKDVPDFSYVFDFIDPLSIATRKLSLFILSSPETLSMEKVLETLVSPRFAQAYVAYNARHRIEKSFSFYRAGSSSETAVITPPVLAAVGNVAYTYVIKLIKTGKLQAIKKEDSRWWFIPVADAVNWLLSRRDCPDWVKRLVQGRDALAQDLSATNVSSIR